MLRQKGTELDPNQNQDVVKCVTQLDILSPFNVRKCYSRLSKKTLKLVHCSPITKVHQGLFCA